MKNGLLIGVSAIVMTLVLTNRAEAQTSNNACGTVATSGSPDVAACISDPSSYPTGIVYNQNNLATPDGILIDIYGTAIVQPPANTNAVQVIGSANNLAVVNLRPGAQVTAAGTGNGVSATASGTGLAEINIGAGATVSATGSGLGLYTTAAAAGGGRISNAGTVTAASGDGVQAVGAASYLLNTGSISSTGVSAIVGTVGLTVTNARGATLVGGADATYGYGVQFAGNGGTFNNYGSATGGAGGVTADNNLSAAGTGVTLNLYSGSTTGAIDLIGGNDTVNLYTGVTTSVADTAIDPVSGALVVVRAAGTYAASATGTISLGGGTNTVSLNGAGTGAAAGTLTLTGTGINAIRKQDAGTWTLTGAASTAVPVGGAATSAATIYAGNGGAATDGTLIFSGSGLTGDIYVDGSTIRSTTAAGFGSGTIFAVDPTIQFGATTTSTNNIVLQTHDTVADPTVLQADNGVTVTLNGSITQGTAGANNVNGQTIAANQPLTFGLTTGSAIGSTATFILGNTTVTPNNWTGTTTVDAGVTLRGTTATISGSSIADNGTVNFSQATTGASAAAIGGTGLLLINGGGDVTLTGAITTAQGVQVGAGTTARLSNASGATANEVNFIGGGASLFVANGGAITATGGNGVFSSQTGNTVNNAGAITGNATYTGVYFNATTGIDTITNSGTISGYNAIDSYATLVLNNTGVLIGLSGSAVYSDSAATASATVTNSGTITGISTGGGIQAAVYIGAGTITNNAGTISGNRGVQIQNGGTVTNAAQITGVSSSGVRLNSGGNVINNVGGTITATAVNAFGIHTTGAGTINNAGTINANSGVVSSVAGVSTTNSGTITAAVNGVWGQAMSVDLTNTGTGVVTGGAAAVRAEAAGSSITNSGTLKAAASSNGQGVYMTGGTLTNQNGGVISGDGTGAAIYLTGTANTVSLQAGSTVNGLIDASSTADASGVYTLAGALNGGFLGGTGNDTLTLITGATETGTLDGNMGTDMLVLDGTGINGALSSAQVINFESGIKNGTGTWTLTGTTAASPTTWAINGGTLNLAGGNALADNATVTIAGGATLALQANETIGALAGAGDVALAANLLTVGGGDGGATFSGVIAGSGGLTKVGTGTEILSGTNTYTGATTVNAGTLTLGASNVLADVTAVTVATGATLDMAAFSDTVGTLALNGTLDGTGTLTASTYGLNGALVNANLGAGTLTQLGGVSVLNGTAAAATANVTAGTLTLGASDRLADTAAVTVATGATLDMAAFSDTVGTLALNGTLDGTGTLTASTYGLNGALVNANLGAGTLTQLGGVSVLNGTAAAATANVDAGTLTLGASDRLADTAAVTVATGATLDMAAFADTVGTLALNGTLDGTGTLTASTYGLNGALVNANLGAGTLTQLGGVSVLNGTAAAATANVTAGTLTLGASDRLADTAAVTVATGATLDMAAFSDTVGTLALNGTLDGTGTLTASTYGLNGALVNANLGAGTLTQLGGVSVLNGTAAAATANVDAGTLTLGASDRLADTAAVTVATGATLDMAAFSDTVGTLALNGTLDGTGTLTASTYGLNGALVNANLGAGTLTQLGGVSVLNGTAAAATANVDAGTLTLGASDRLADTAAVTVATGATLDMAAFSDTVGTLALNGTLDGTGTLTASTYGLNGALVNANLGAGTLTQLGGVSVLNGTAAAATANVDAGTLTLGASNRLADTAAVTVATGATLDMAAFSDTVGTLALNGTLDGTGTLTASTYGLNGALVNANLGAGTLTQLGGVSVLNGTAAAATANVDAGTLTLGASNRLADTAAVTVATGATLDMAAFSDTVGTLALNGTLDGTGTLTASTYGLNGALVNANLGAGTLTQLGGVSVLNGTAAAATANVDAGTLTLGASDRLADTAAVTVATGATLDMAAFSDTVGTLALNGTLDGTGTLTASTYGLNGALVNANLGAGTLTQLGGVSVLNGTAAAATANVDAGTLTLGASNRLADTAAVTVATGATLDMAAFSDTVGTLALNGTLDGTGTLTASTYGLNGALVNANLGAGTLTQLGGVSVLNGTAAAATANVTAGTLTLGASNRLADTAAVTVATGATLDMAAFSDTVGTLALNGTLDGTGTLTASTYGLNGALVNANLGAGTLTQLGGVSVLNGTAAAATANVDAGTLTLGASNRLADTAAVTVATGATLDLAAFSDTVGTLALNGTLDGTGTLTASTYGLNGALVNANLGAGTLTQLGGVSTLTGTVATNTIAINAGMLRLAAADRIVDNAQVTVTSGATFDLANFGETIGSLSGAGAVTLGSGTLSVGAANTVSTFNGTLTGTGDLTKVGTGTLSLAGIVALTGRLNVNGGTLLLNGSTPGAVRVQGGTFGGNATVAGALTQSSGTIAPGSTTQRVGQIQAASFTTTGGTLAIDFGGSASGFTADSLKITGAASLSGVTVSTAALDSSASYNFVQTYQVLQAGSISGTFGNGSTFAQVSTDTPDLYWRLRTDLVPNAVLLEVRKIISFGTTLGAGSTANQVAVGEALTTTELTGSESWNTFLNTIANETPAQRQTTFDSLGGESIADITSSAASISSSFVSLLRRRLATGGSGDNSSVVGLLGGREGLSTVRANTLTSDQASALNGASGSRGGAWVQGFGGAGRLQGRNGTATVNDDSYGIAAGLDGRIGMITLGAAFSIASLDARVTDRASTNKGTLYQGGGYASYDNGQAYVSLIGNYFSGTVDSARQVLVGGVSQGQATGEARVHGATIGATGGYRIQVGTNSHFTPQASIEGTRVIRNSFTENGAGLLNLEAARQSRTLYTATLEGRFNHVVESGAGSIEPYIGGGVAIQFGDRNTLAANRFTGAPIGTGAFTIEGVRLAPVIGLVNFGLQARPSKNVTLGIGAEGRLGDHQRDGRLEAHIRLGF